MSDRTGFRAYVYDCPEDQREAALTVLAEDYALGVDWTDQPAGDLDLTSAYTADEITCGSAQEIAKALREAAPGASFILWEDPKYEWLGDLYAHTPALGEFTAECAESGEPVLNREQVTKVINDAAKDAPGTPGGMLRVIRDAINRAMGGPWFDDWHAHTQAEPVTAATGQETGQ